MGIRFTEEQIYNVANAMYNAVNSDEHYLDYIGDDEVRNVILDLETKNATDLEKFEKKVSGFIDEFHDDFEVITRVADKFNDEGLSDYDDINEEGEALAASILNRITDYFSDWI
ncbi:MAG: hypothetical protein IKP75_04485 [Oscillospiraceae bacterium]|nr:hypothetical protein [Oscillospiraceae bacterium]